MRTQHYLLVLGIAGAGVLAGCRGQTSEDPPIVPIRNMYGQPKYSMQQGSEYFEDGRAMRPLPDGVIAHDMQRRIVLFNRAAEEITGRRRQDVVGHDCHQVFGCGFCGGKCVLDGPVPQEPDFDEPLQAPVGLADIGDPRVAAIIARLAEPTRNLAAYGVAFSFTLFLAAWLLYRRNWFLRF